jgi:DNA excision repair protein ERCC-3
MYYSAKRQQYLVDQGYTFKVIQDLVEIADKASTLLQSKKQECDLLSLVLNSNTTSDDLAEEKAIRKNVDEDYDNVNQTGPAVGRQGAETESRGGTGPVLMGKGIVQNLSRPGAHVVLGGQAPAGGRGRGRGGGRLAGVKRKVSSLGGVSGVDGASYEEFSRK